MRTADIGAAAVAVLVGAVMTAVILGVVRLSRSLFQRLLKPRAFPLPAVPLAADLAALVDARSPLARRLRPPERERLRRLVALFLHEVPFEGCDGLVLTDGMRVVIAANACLLLLNMPYPRYPRLRRVLVYPDAFVPVRLAGRHSGIAEAEPAAELGEAWQDGMVVLAWSSVAATETEGSGHNVVLHEFAHILDSEDGVMNGVPILADTASAEAWRAMLGTEFARQEEDVRQCRRAALDPYAATNRAEFFAVATEAFFETPAELQERVPAIYEQLQRFYQQDPAADAGAGSREGRP